MVIIIAFVFAIIVLLIVLLRKNYCWAFLMANLESFVSRHGEFGAQALVERIERYEGIWPAIDATLEDRWETIMEKNWPTEKRVAG